MVGSNLRTVLSEGCWKSFSKPEKHNINTNGYNKSRYLVFWVLTPAIKIA
jgi:hypothetical protein